jgi:hypothetical protein
MTFIDQMAGNSVGGTTFLSQPQLRKWFENAPRGAGVIYATGDLAHDRRNAVDASGQLNAAANYAHHLALLGYAELTQRRLDKCCYEYRIRKK